MDKLTQLVSDYLQAQVEAGAQALQVFDSWVGALGPSDFAEHVLPYSRRVVRVAQETGVPVIHFGTNTNGMLGLMRETGADVIGVDWRIHLDEAWSELGHDIAIQGNLDPVALLGNWSYVERRAADILRRAHSRPGHIFNLGHGILPQTPVENVAALADYVHEWDGRQS
jgi:uroporphyrinogen decarboxylase